MNGFLLGIPGDWRHRARCRDVDPELFFPLGTTGPAEAQILTAKAVCGLCPVRETCLQWALDTRQDAGVWGGLSEEERRRIRQGPRRRGGGRHGGTYCYDQGCRCRLCTDAKTDAARRSRARQGQAS